MSKEEGRVQLETLGETKAPLLLIEGEEKSTEELRRYAVHDADFSSDGVSMYPGIRAPLPRGYVIACVKSLLPYLRKVYRIPAELKPHPMDNYYSLVTAEEHELEPVQTVPHFDTNNPYFIAIIHYLNEGGFGGTGFFRHRKTGFEYVTAQRRDEYLASVKTFVSSDFSPPAYVTEAHPEFELYKKIDYQRNRMAIYQGCMLHSGLINPKTDISSDPATGRLTANIFIDFR